MVDDFERRASVHAYDHLELRHLWSQWEIFRDDVIPRIHRSAEWLEYLVDLGRCAARSDHVGTEAATARPLLPSKGEEEHDRTVASVTPPSPSPSPHQESAATTSSDSPEQQVPTPNKLGGPKLAAWLAAEMEKRDHMTNNGLHDLTGLDRKTIKAILAGQSVTNVRLHKLAAGLSLPVSDIPTD